MLTYENISMRMHQQLLFCGATLHVHAGEKVVLRGSSGSGKSSLLKSTVGAAPLEDGSIRVDDLKLTAETVATIRSRISFIGQEPVLGAEKVRDALLLPFSFKVHQDTIPTENNIRNLLVRGTNFRCVGAKGVERGICKYTTEIEYHSF